ncbi:bacterio-opsin activator domain-containing protein [Halomarina litorea]|uniref:bacterio-opsin activator domain-containing protein n=1 Tax=Halomarina litorea TaxID=2961595 RepID=UPI0020C4EE07|nr:bacterio-opsin activator domain-containing protein [Halomarina sp. BCD28]
MVATDGSLRSSHVLLVGDARWTAEFGDRLRTVGASVDRVGTAEDALEVVRNRATDCVVSEYSLDAATGVELVESVRARTSTLPVVVCTAEGDETVASAAIGAGVSDYVAFEGVPREQFDDLHARVERCVQAAARSASRRDRARQFEATFGDARAATWVLDDGGALVRANRTAREWLSDAAEGTDGEQFWTLPWWEGEEGVEDDVRRVVGTALDGELGHAVVSRPQSSGRPAVVEMSARPVHDEFGGLVSVVVEGVDITERVTLERNLRQSEELHRVTLNNMTDTVLMTNEAGEYTYVCPNVHFIFGYTADEIHRQGTIDELLGTDLFDRDELAESGVLKNIECTATDKAGREHTLLVNVREVSIQDGALLYSCRDISKRKQREEALATLHATARDFLYAETSHEIARHVVDDAPSVVGLDASAVYLFDAEGNDLRPAAQSDEMRELAGPLSPVPTDGSRLVSDSFLHDEARFVDDAHKSDHIDDPTTGLGSVASIPLGDHGVFVVGSAERGRFGEVARELADLLAATAEAALDRVRRESRLRRQDRELQRRNADLTALARTNDIIREIDQALVAAETRPEVEHAVCQRLTGEDRFAFAWIGVVDEATGTVEPRSWAGDERGYLDDASFTVAETGTEPAGRTAATRTASTVKNVADHLRGESWRTSALSRDFRSALSVPLAYDEFTYGVLTVYADTPRAFDDTTRAVLSELGETIASATSAIERKNALLTTSVTRLEFGTDDQTFVLSRLAHEAGCTLSYRGGVQQTDRGAVVFVTVEGTSVEAVEAAAERLVAVDDLRSIGADGHGGVVRLRVSQPFLALELADHGAVLHRVDAGESATSLVVEVPETVDVHHISRLVSNAVGPIDLRSKRTLDQSSTHDLRARFLDRVTDRQLEVVQTAHYSGFFESPRESTGEEVAATLDISPAAFYRHVRTVQRKLFSTLFDEAGVAAFSAPPPE